MAKEDLIKLSGKVVELLPNTMFKVKLENFENPVLAVINGRMRKHNIKILLGDAVELEFSQYDLTRGRITRRN